MYTLVSLQSYCVSAGVVFSSCLEEQIENEIILLAVALKHLSESSFYTQPLVRSQREEKKGESL